ncbi:hypothetical protein EJ08DRAFT_645956 [Tothia fuscella]|uniref:Fork-head domain-containing protein n=1 Tax=Tothia fuscella TaxID=1048955 RepID=A0A9P4P0A6_9PEZI|nr:hypothetical protein EJ08DRAFT_645956 [Tothia fuscella]
MLISQSTLLAPNRRLTLADICKWISDSFSFYNLIDSDRHSSIHYNIRLNMAVDVQKRLKDDASPPRTIHDFLRYKVMQRNRSLSFSRFPR